MRAAGTFTCLITQRIEKSETEGGNIQEFTPWLSGICQLQQTAAQRVSGDEGLGEAWAREKILDVTFNCWIQC